MSRSSRLALWCVALLVFLSLYIKGRAPAGKGEGAAFLRPGAGAVKVRLAGDFPRPGLYLFPDGTPLATAIKMTLPEFRPERSRGAAPSLRLSSGDVVTLACKGGECPVISLGKMGVKERMLLKIPLDPDLLAVGDWDALPGIGPVLAERIVADRHKYGAFGSLQGVLRVPGVGPGKLAALERFF